MEFQVAIAGIPFNLEYTLQSGQVFRWDNRGQWWYGVVSGGVLKVRQEGETLRCGSSEEHLDSAFVRNYFRLDEDLEGVYASIARDEIMTRAVEKFYGMRLIRQERWECLASFVLATNSNIPSIRRMIANLCSNFGAPLDFDGISFRTFPRAERIAEASVAELEECGLGYRAPFMGRVARAVDEGKIDFSEVALASYLSAREVLLRRFFGEKLLLGVGPKVADCVLLFSCEKNEAFPIDVWIARAIARFYPQFLDASLTRRLSSKKKVTLTRSEYESSSLSARAYFGRCAGYAQQYLYMLARAEGAGQVTS